ncbi:sensor histidine kinase [Streptomyces avicenniae]|uniref:sensor histidine kinase n=1 Tax=Streptomyces avicenniae TaxID=500153 RepID=UPI00069B3EA6|nr:HAMP domain-containing sensor histidine kinase [Streptomyces avicenniae]
MTARGRGSLTRAVVLLTLVVAAVAIALTGLSAWRVVGGTTEALEREQLARRAEVLSRTPAVSGLLLDRERRIAGSDGSRLAVVSPSGEVTGPAAGAVGEGTRRRLLDGEAVATTAELDGQRVLLAGHPSGDGGERGAVVLTQPFTEVDGATDRMRAALVLPLAAGLLGAAGAGALMARRLARPIVVAAGTAHRLAAGERGLRVPAGGPAELTELAEALEALDAALARSEGRQHDFLLSVSHELRTPLTTVRGYAEALADGVVAEGEVPAAGRTLLAETRRLDRLVNDLLDLARMDADDFGLDLVAVDLDALVGDAARVWGRRCAERGLDFRVERPGCPVVLVTDGARVRQLIDGLAGNALRVTPAGRPLVLALYEAGGAWCVEVRDGGPGLTEEDAEVAFVRGALHARYRDVRPGGSGLGLAIAWRLATRLGGTITARGDAPEGGARFTVTLPGAAADR